MLTRRHVMPIVAIAFLSACGAGGSDGGSGNARSFNAELRAEQALLNSYVGSGPLAGDAIPTSGDATYRGQLAFGIQNDQTNQALRGQMEMTVGFDGAGAVSGTVTDFVYVDFAGLDRDAPLPAVDGELAFSNGAVSRVNSELVFPNGEVVSVNSYDGIQLRADLDGTLVSSVDAFGVDAGTNLVVDSEILGSIGANYVEGGFNRPTLTPQGSGAINLNVGGFSGVTN